jgi:hypothetical protein
MMIVDEEIRKGLRVVVLIKDCLIVFECCDDGEGLKEKR